MYRQKVQILADCGTMERSPSLRMALQTIQWTDQSDRSFVFSGQMYPKKPGDTGPMTLWVCNTLMMLITRDKSKKYSQGKGIVALILI